MDFYTATPDSEIVRSMVWEDETASASDRFAARAVTYTDYIWHINSIYQRANSAFDGGTWGIVYPHKDATGLVTDVTGYYMSGTGSYAKTTYPSYFGNGYFALGYQSTLSLGNLQKDFNRGEGYTIQVFAAFLPGPDKDSVSNQSVFMFGPTRIGISASDMDTIFMRASSYSLETNNWASADVVLGDFYTIENYTRVTYTISLTNPPTSRTETTESFLDLYINTIHVAEAQPIATTKLNETLFKIGEGADTQLYALRIYKRTLTDDEIKQNHFADMALYFGLDISGFQKLSAAKKTAAYEALASVNTNTPKADVEAAYKAAIK